MGRTSRVVPVAGSPAKTRPPTIASSEAHVFVRSADPNRTAALTAIADAAGFDVSVFATPDEVLAELAILVRRPERFFKGSGAQCFKGTPPTAANIVDGGLRSVAPARAPKRRRPRSVALAAPDDRVASS